MRILQWQRFWVLALGLLVSSCVDPYTPEIDELQLKLLVVDGFINSQGPTSFRLSRTQGLQDKGGPFYESGASVWVEEEGGGKVLLAHSGNGTYTANVAVKPTKKYRLHIKTSNQKDYLSDFVPVKISPPIDEVTWRIENNGVQLYLSTHDDNKLTQYYRWDYTETFEFVSAQYSNLDFINRRIVPRTNNIYRCWRTANSSDILLASSARLGQDRIHEFPLLRIPRGSVKLGFLYSILVKQTAQTKESYQYWETLRRNTESIGTLFDPLPTNLTGNIRCVTNPEEPVLGFVTATSVTEKRIFIASEALPQNWSTVNEYAACLADTITPQEVLTKMANKIPVSEILNPMGTVIGYVVGAEGCIDCRFRGTNVKPAYWPR